MKNRIIKKVLKNGVKLYLYNDKNMKRVLVSYGINYGSSGEYTDFYLDGIHQHVLPGCAHFLEHLLLEHSKYGNLYTKYTSKKYNRNGFTTMNYTNYYFIGVDDIYNSIKELITAIQDPIFTSEDISKTSESIISETRMIRDNKIRISRSIVDRNFYSGLELVSDTLCLIGNEETTKKIDYEMLMNCYNAFYCDDNKVLLVAGNIDVDKMIDYIESVYEELPSHKNRRKKYEYILGDIRNKEQVEYMSSQDDYVYLGFRNSNIEGFSRKEMFYYLTFILDSKFCIESETYELLKNENIITGSLDYLQRYINDVGIHFYFGATCKNVEKFVLIIKSELEKKDFTLEEFNIFKKRIISEQAFLLDSKYDVLKNFIFKLDISDDLDDIDFIKSMKFERACEFYSSLNFDKYTMAIIRKKEN